MENKSNIRRGRHSVYDLHVHLVFVTKYRRKVFNRAHLEEMKHVMDKVCADFGCLLEEFNGEDNHVHLLVSFTTDTQISKLVNSLKGVSSRRLRKQFPELIDLCWNRQQLWTPGYYSGTTGGAGIEAVRRYIETQNTP